MATIVRMDFPANNLSYACILCNSLGSIIRDFRSDFFLRIYIYSHLPFRRTKQSNGQIRGRKKNWRSALQAGKVAKLSNVGLPLCRPDERLLWLHITYHNRFGLYRRHHILCCFFPRIFREPNPRAAVFVLPFALFGCFVGIESCQCRREYNKKKCNPGYWVENNPLMKNYAVY